MSWLAYVDDHLMREMDVLFRDVADLSPYVAVEDLPVEDLIEVLHGIIHLPPGTNSDIVRGGGDPFQFPDAIKVIEDIGWESQKRRMEEWEVSTGQLKLEMAETRADQKRMREGQMEVREKFKEIERQCAQLSEETNLISQQIKGTKLRMILLSKISQAREHKDFVKARKLSNCLRELIASQNEKERAIKMTRTSTKD